MYRHNHVLLHSKDVIHRMRAPYPAALAIHRYTYRLWAIDVVTYDELTWVAYLFGIGVDGKRIGPFASQMTALTESKTQVDFYATHGVTEPPPKKVSRGTKRPPRKKKENS
jgi:hypothetical protein